MLTVAHILYEKEEKYIYTISAQATAFDAMSLMADKGIGALVVAEDNHVEGIISERDLVRKIELFGLTARETIIATIMTQKVLTVTRQQTVQECLSLMTERHLRHLPVVEDGSLIGLISIGDLVKAVIQEQQTTIDQLQHYISN